MTHKPSDETLPLTKNLRRSFENAVRDIYQAGLTGTISRYRSPIVQRPKLTTSESTLSAEKRALADAARALAQLWKVPQTSSR